MSNNTLATSDRALSIGLCYLLKIANYCYEQQCLSFTQSFEYWRMLSTEDSTVIDNKAVTPGAA